MQVTSSGGLPDQEAWMPFMPVQDCENFSTSMCYIAVLCKQLLYSLAAESLMIKAPQQHSISTQTAKPRSLDNSKAQHSKVLVHKVCTVAT